MIRVVIADDHHLVRHGIRAILEKSNSSIEIVGEAADGQEAVAVVERLIPDVVLMDIVMPRLNGTQAIKKINHLNLPTHVVVLSMYSDQLLVKEVLKNGAKGYLLKSSLPEELLLAIRAVARGEVFLSPEVAKHLVNSYLYMKNEDKQVDSYDLLSPREIEVLQLIAEGYTNNSIAETINVSVKTVEKHRTSIMRKLNIHNLAGLVRFAIKRRLISLE